MALTDGLISYWKMDGSSGNPIDSVGNNTAVNSNVTFSSGKINNGAVFNGSSSNLKVSTPSFNFFGTSKFTYNSFIKINSLTSFGIIFQMRQDAGVTENLQFYLNNQTINSQFFTTSGNAGVTTGNVITNTTDFFMVTTKYDGVSVYVYINGSLVGSPVALTGTFRQNNAFWMLGQNAVYGGNFNGVIDEVGVWNRDLSNSEITQLYNSGSGLQYPFGGVTPTANSRFLQFFR